MIKGFLPLCLAALLAACGRQPAAEAQRNGAAAPAGMRLALLPPSDESDAAAMEGVLRAEGPCLYVAGPGARRGGSLLAFLIPRVRWDEHSRRLVARGKSFAAGDLVVVGGSYATDAARLAWRQPPDPSCDVSRVWVTGSIDPGPYRGAAERGSRPAR